MSLQKNAEQDALVGLIFAFKQAMRKALASHEMDINGMQLQVLHAIAHRSPCTANQLATSLSRDKAQITRLLKDLIALDVVEKQPNPDDKRSQLLSLTPKGQALMQKTRRIKDDLRNAMLQGISADELAQFYAIAGRMKDNLPKA